MIAWYVHHHGTGHRRRAAAIAAKLRTPVLGLSSDARPDDWPGAWLQLPDDASGVDVPTADVTAGATFHWVPRHHDGLRSRMGAISSSLVDGDVRLLVSDVSVEVSVLARLHGVPVAIMAQPGERTDRAHRLAYDLADHLLAPWPEHPTRPWPAAWRSKTTYLGGISRYDGSTPVPASARLGARPAKVLVFWGSGGIDVPRHCVHAAARATPLWTWQLAGPTASVIPADVPPNLLDLGWVDDMWPLLCQADVVVTHAGQNAIAEVAAARRPAVVIAQRRPFAEQHATLDALRRSRLASVSAGWPPAEEWPGLLDSTVGGRGDAWVRWSFGDGAQKAATVLDGLVSRP